MTENLKTTMTARFVGEASALDIEAIMETFCNETVRMINYHLKREAKDPESFEAEVAYGWFQIPEERGLYAIQVTGPHSHQRVCEMGEGLQAEADTRGYPIELQVLRV